MLKEVADILLTRSKFFYPDMFRHIVAILRGSRLSDKLLKQCSVLWTCADYDPSRVTICRGVRHSRLPEDGYHVPKHDGVEKFGTY
jgi:hypothetical protein